MGSALPLPSRTTYVRHGPHWPKYSGSATRVCGRGRRGDEAWIAFRAWKAPHSSTDPLCGFSGTCAGLRVRLPPVVCRESQSKRCHGSPALPCFGAPRGSRASAPVSRGVLYIWTVDEKPCTLYAHRSTHQRSRRVSRSRTTLLTPKTRVGAPQPIPPSRESLWARRRARAALLCTASTRDPR